MTIGAHHNAFFAMSWDPEDATARSFAHKLDRKMSPHLCASKCVTSGFSLFDLSDENGCNRITSIEPKHEISRGAVFGQMFRTLESSEPNCESLHLSDEEQVAIAHSLGEVIPQRYWGRYVAFLKTDSGFSVISDPTSGIPCFYTIINGVVLVFSNLELCDFLDKSQFTINTDFIRKLLVYDKIQTGETGLLEVSELLGGQRIIFRKNECCKNFIWNPGDVARQPFSGGPEAAAQLLKRTTEQVAAAWAARFKRIELNLSGGLDSSIVLACLSKAIGPEQVRAVHYLLDSDDLSELKFAQMASEHFRCPLAIEKRSPRSILPPPDSHPPSVRPFREFLEPEDSVYELHPGTMTFTGQGGDHLFWAKRSHVRLSDYLAIKGINWRVFSEIAETAQLTGKSIFDVVNCAADEVLRRDAQSEFIQAMVDRETRVTAPIYKELDLHDLRPFAKSWTEGLPRGKAEQVGSLMHLVHVRTAMARNKPRSLVHPLISQPLLELCLRIPTFLLSYRGESRGLIRAAFSKELPPQIARRFTKGRASRFFSEQTRTNQPRIREALAFGALVEMQIVQSQDVLRFIDCSEYRTHKYGKVLPNLYMIEAWLRTWISIAKNARTDCAESIW